LQETQAPWQAELQQTPSTQKPEKQSALLVQVEPLMRLPQLPLESQVWPATHWSEDIQWSRHAPPLQVNGAQMMIGPVSQLPRPSQMLWPTSAPD
jgi:hypothetical protein